MAYLRQPYRGLSGAESCGQNQIWSPDFVYNGIKGQCLSAEQYNAWQAQKKAAADAAAAGTKSEPSWLDKLLGATTEVIKAKVTPGGTTVIQSTPGSGMSTTTKVAIAGAAAVGLVLVLRTMKK